MRAKLQRHLAALQHRPFDLVHAVDLALLVVDLALEARIKAHVHPDFEASNCRFQMLDLFLLGSVGLLLAEQRQLLLGDES